MKQLSLWARSMLPQPTAAARARFRRGQAFRRHQPAPRLRYVPADRAAQVFWADPEQSPQDRWYAVEDLLLRVAARRPVHAVLVHDHWHITLAGILAQVDDEARSLAAIATDKETFVWRSEGQRGCYAQAVLREGGDLVIVLSSAATIARWPLGVDLAWQVTALMCRLRVSPAAAGLSLSSRYAADLRRRPRASCATTRATSSPPSSSSAPAMRSSKANDG